MTTSERDELQRLRSNEAALKATVQELQQALKDATRQPWRAEAPAAIVNPWQVTH